MRGRLLLGWLAAAASVAFIHSPALASAVDVTYYTLTSANQDTGGTITGVVKGLVKSTLGPDGLPVESTPGTFKDVNAAGELLWWTPNSVSGTPWVLAGTSHAYPSTVTLPFNITSNFFPNGSSGPNGGTVGYTSAELTGSFVTPAGGSVTFNLGSDDDAWVFVDGKLVVDNGGIHSFANTPTVVSGLAPGTNTIDVFFDERHVSQAGLFFNADVTINPSVPEPSTWAMMLLGFASLGFAGYRRARKVAVPVSAT